MDPQFSIFIIQSAGVYEAEESEKHGTLLKVKNKSASSDLQEL